MLVHNKIVWPANTRPSGSSSSERGGKVALSGSCCISLPASRYTTRSWVLIKLLFGLPLLPKYLSIWTVTHQLPCHNPWVWASGCVHSRRSGSSARSPSGLGSCRRFFYIHTPRHLINYITSMKNHIKVTASASTLSSVLSWPLQWWVEHNTPFPSLILSAPIFK